MTALHIFSVLCGGVLIVAMLTDAIATLIVTQGKSGRWRPTRIWYTLTWRWTRAVAARLPSSIGESSLNAYPALSLLGLLVLWIAGLIFGWALIYWGLQETVGGARDFGTVLYFSATSDFTPSFGAVRGGARPLSVFETLTGLGTIALLISYLPALYGAYSRREARLLTLDDPSGRRITPLGVIAVNSRGGNLEQLYRFFAEWEMWVAEVLESHVSYPMLALFRSQNEGQSWITALGVVTDAATLACCAIEGAIDREAYLLHRRGRRAIQEICDRLHVPDYEPDLSWVNRENFDMMWSQFATLDLPRLEADDVWKAMVPMAGTYRRELQRLIDYLVAPHGFWGHSSEETVAEEVALAAEEARRRARST